MEKIIEAEVLGRPIEVSAGWRGRDLLVTVTGGDAAHIGSTRTGLVTEWELLIPSVFKTLIGSVSVCRMQNGGAVMEKIVLPTHRDDVVGDSFAQALAQKLGTTVCVVSGIHFDGASKQNIAEIVNSTNKMLAQLLEHFN